MAILVSLCLLLLTGCAQSAEPGVSASVTAVPSASPVPTAVPLTPMAELLLEIYEEYDPALGAMETKRRCEELLAAWTADGEDGAGARNAAELLVNYGIERDKMGEKLDTLRKMAARLCASDSGFVRDPTAQNALPDADSVQRLFEALSEGLSLPGNS